MNAWVEPIARAPDQHAFDDLVRRLFEQHAIFERAGLGFVRIAHQIARAAVVGQERPLAAGRETRSAAAAQAGLHHELHDLGRLHLGHGALPLLVPAAFTVDADVAQVEFADAFGQDALHGHG